MGKIEEVVKKSKNFYDHVKSDPALLVPFLKGLTNITNAFPDGSMLGLFNMINSGVNFGIFSGQYLENEQKSSGKWTKKVSGLAGATTSGAFLSAAVHNYLQNNSAGQASYDIPIQLLYTVASSSWLISNDKNVQKAANGGFNAAGSFLFVVSGIHNKDPGEVIYGVSSLLLNGYLALKDEGERNNGQSR